MTPQDIARAAADYDLHKRAAARCLTAEPHRAADEDWPCSGCLLAAARLLAIPHAHVAPTAALAPFSLDRRRAEGAYGVVGPRALPASLGLATPPSKIDRADRFRHRRDRLRVATADGWVLDMGEVVP